MEFNLNVLKFMSAICFGMLILLTGCIYKPMEFDGNFPISRDKAIMIAATNVPPIVIREASLSIIPPGKFQEEPTSINVRDACWVARFQFFGNNVSSISKSELGWSESSGDTFRYIGNLPKDRFRLLEITIDPYTGIVISREASDGYVLGPTEPPPVTDYTLLFISIGSGIFGLIVGALGVWLVFRRRRTTSAGVSDL